VCRSKGAFVDQRSSDCFQSQTFTSVSTERFPLAVQFPVGTGAHGQHVKLKLIAENAPRSLPVHPTQLYEAVMAFALALVLHMNFGKRRRAGDVFSLMLVGYGIIRFAVEFFRADNAPAYLGLTISQVISVAFIFTGGLTLLWRGNECCSRKSSRTPCPEKLFPLGSPFKGSNGIASLD
jgi:phosphatidylglycerol:prolipoprotein diacylglycerol transferase